MLNRNALSEIVTGNVGPAMSQFPGDLQSDLLVEISDLLHAQTGGVRRILTPLFRVQAHHRRTMEIKSCVLLIQLVKPLMGVGMTLSMEMELRISRLLPDISQGVIGKIFAVGQGARWLYQRCPAIPLGKLLGFP